MPEAIFEDGPVGTPYVYTVSGTGTVTPRACQAVYDGTGAGGNFVPAVIFRSKAGNVIARAILDTTIAAGASAEVSWFPGVKHAASAPPAPSAPIYGILSLSGNNFSDPPFSVPSGGTADVQFLHQSASDSGAFAFLPSTSYSDTISLTSLDYLYVCRSSVRWNATGFNQFGDIIGPSPSLPGSFLFGALDNHGLTRATSFATANSPLGGPYWAVDTKTFVCETVPQNVTLQVLHDAVGNEDVGEANLLVVAYKVF